MFVTQKSESVRMIVKVKERPPGEKFIQKRRELRSAKASNREIGLASSMKGLPKSQGNTFRIRKNSYGDIPKFFVFNQMVETHKKEAEQIQNQKLANISNFLQDIKYQTLFQEDSLFEDFNEDQEKPDVLPEIKSKVIFESKTVYFDCFINKQSIIRNPIVSSRSEFLCSAELDEKKKNVLIHAVDPKREASTSCSFSFKVQEYWSIVNENGENEIFDDLSNICVQILKNLVFANGLFPRQIIQKKLRKLPIYSKLLNLFSKDLSLNPQRSSEGYYLLVSDQVPSNLGRPISANAFFEKPNRPNSKYGKSNNVSYYSNKRKTSPIRSNKEIHPRVIHESPKSGKKQNFGKDLMLFKHSYIDDEDINFLSLSILKPAKTTVFHFLSCNLEFIKNVDYIANLIEDTDFFVLKNGFSILKKYAFTEYKRNDILLKNTFHSLLEQSRGCLVNVKFARMIQKRNLTYDKKVHQIYFFLIMEKEQLMIRSISKEISPLHVDLYENIAKSKDDNILNSFISKVFLKKVEYNQKTKFIVGILSEREFKDLIKIQRAVRRYLISKRFLKLRLESMDFEIGLKVVKQIKFQYLILSNQYGFININSEEKFALQLERNSEITINSFIPRIMYNSASKKLKFDLNPNRFIKIKKIHYIIRNKKKYLIKLEFNPEIKVVRIMGIENKKVIQQEMKSQDIKPLHKFLEKLQNELFIDFTDEIIHFSLNKSEGNENKVLKEINLRGKKFNIELFISRFPKFSKIQLISTIIKDHYKVEVLKFPDINKEEIDEKTIFKYLKFSPRQLLFFNEKQFQIDMEQKMDEEEAKQINLKDKDVQNAASLIQKKFRLAKSKKENLTQEIEIKLGDNIFLKSFRGYSIPQINVYNNTLSVNGKGWTKELEEADEKANDQVGAERLFEEMQEKINEKKRMDEEKNSKQYPSIPIAKIENLHELTYKPTYEKVIFEKGSESERESQSRSPEQKIQKMYGNTDEFRISLESNLEINKLEIPNFTNEGTIKEVSERNSDSSNSKKSLDEVKSPDNSSENSDDEEDYSQISPNKLKNDTSSYSDDPIQDRRISRSNVELSITHEGGSPIIRRHSNQSIHDILNSQEDEQKEKGNILKLFRGSLK